ncbi:MAG: bifunctional aldolase/short-chain dehydrogenase, partial [Gammaproteobacteria bacterium]|nr:bifunctional aldolase/short-chain dehydrogenase [Gammaproteobacteria bacterium]
MNSLWSDSEAEAFPGDLGQRIYTSRLLGREKSLVLHGGGNTSVKVTEKNLLGEDETRLYVKGSGWDLEHIEAAGFSPVRIDRLLKLAKLKQLSDPQMVNELRTQMTLASAPTPSVEAILHAILPYQYVDHTHADAVITITNTADGLTRIREIYGDNVVIVPYVMPGFDLARRCAEQFATDVRKNTIGMVLMNHGIFSFGKTAQESYERMIDLVTWAENYLAKQKAWVLPESSEKPQAKPLRRELAALRRDLSVTAGFPVILAAHDDPASLAFARRDDIAIISQQGPATPDHVIRTKRVPMIGRDSKAYAKAYKKYFDENLPKSTEPKTMLDPSPRVILDREFGVATAGRSAKDAAIVFDIYAHTMEILQRATLLGGYKALPAKDIFDVEYWDLEQAKLKGAGKPPFAGEIALVTGAASGIGKACVDSLLARGAAVVGLDINASISSLYNRPDYLGLVCDVTDEKQLAEALEKTARTFGGLDMLILNAGMFPPGCRIDALGTAEWGKVMRLNLDANLMLMREAHPLLKLAPNGGCVVVIGSKNVPAPGPGAAAYSASKAALNQLARVAALEWGADNIRINSL